MLILEGRLSSDRVLEITVGSSVIHTDLVESGLVESDLREIGSDLVAMGEALPWAFISRLSSNGSAASSSSTSFRTSLGPNEVAAKGEVIAGREANKGVLRLLSGEDGMEPAGTTSALRTLRTW